MEIRITSIGQNFANIYDNHSEILLELSMQSLVGCGYQEMSEGQELHFCLLNYFLCALSTHMHTDIP